MNNESGSISLSTVHRPDFRQSKLLTAIGLVGSIAAVDGHITFKMGRYTIGFVKLITITAELIRFTFRRCCRRGDRSQDVIIEIILDHS